MLYALGREEQVLAAARSRSCSNNAPRCHSLRSRRFATLPYRVFGESSGVRRRARDRRAGVHLPPKALIKAFLHGGSKPPPYRVRGNFSSVRRQ